LSSFSAIAKHEAGRSRDLFTSARHSRQADYVSGYTVMTTERARLPNRRQHDEVAQIVVSIAR